MGAVSAAGASAAPAGAGVLTVSGNQFLLDGVPFIPRGFTSIALLNSPWCTTTATAAAAAAFTPSELQLARTSWNANTLRFHVSQPVLAGPNGAAYAQQVDAAVNQVRSQGFVVIIDMQDQSRACGPAEPLPSPETETAWATLVANSGLSRDPDVMLDLFNEPANQPTMTPTTDPKQTTWVDWLNGGRQIGPGTGWAAYVPVGHQQLVNFLRNQLNVPNILIASGAAQAEHLEGMPLLNDPGGSNQIAYAVHPYFYTDSVAGWATRWGYLASTQALIGTARDYTGSGCGTASQQLAPTLLSYMRNTLNVGMLGQALDDFGNGVIADGALTPTQCGTAKPGGGADFLQYYAATFQPTAVAAPVVTGTALGAREVDLSWTAPADTAGIARYDLFRDGAKVTSTTGRTFTDTAIAPTTTYGYTVVATDTVGNVSPPSAVASVTTGTGSPPYAPTGLAATYGPLQITLSWTAAQDPGGAVAGYDVYRGGVRIATTTATTLRDSPVSEATPYTYTVDAFDAHGGVSALSAPLIATAPDDQPPTAPARLTLTPGSKRITLKWAASTDNVGVKSYRVYRKTALIATVASPTLTYTNTGLTTGASYSYHVVAVDAAGNASASSATLTAKAR